jgi:hypothetical protein
MKIDSLIKNKEKLDKEIYKIYGEINEHDKKVLETIGEVLSDLSELKEKVENSSIQKYIVKNNL